MTCPPIAADHAVADEQPAEHEADRQDHDDLEQRLGRALAERGRRDVRDVDDARRAGRCARSRRARPEVPEPRREREAAEEQLLADRRDDRPRRARPRAPRATMSAVGRTSGGVTSRSCASTPPSDEDAERRRQHDRDRRAGVAQDPPHGATAAGRPAHLAPRQGAVRTTKSQTTSGVGDRGRDERCRGTPSGARPGRAAPTATEQARQEGRPGEDDAEDEQRSRAAIAIGMAVAPLDDLVAGRERGARSRARRRR